ILVVVAAAAALLGVLGNNAWVAWMAELVPAQVRCRYFGRRIALYTMGTSVASLVAGAILDVAGARGLTNYALSFLAAVACLVGAASTVLLVRQHDPAPNANHTPLNFKVALRPFSENGPRRVLAFQIVWNAAIGLSSVFLTLHMLKNLGM